ncbi:MAG: ABC transporter ATP-binding protein [Gemmatimonadetes bacterium]|nr:ABC transporter ATP-binding protein [Gemmatimonadota bacterium]
MNIYKTHKSTAFYFIKFLMPYWWQGLIVLVCILFTTVSSLIPPYLLKVIIDDILLPKQLEWLILAVSVLAGLMLAELVISSVSDYLYAWISNCIVRDLRIDLFSHLMTVALDFHNRQNTGDVVFRLSNDIGVIQSVLSASVLRFLYSFLTLIGLIAVLCWMAVDLFLLSMAVVPFFVLNLIYFQPQIKKVVEVIQHKGSDIYRSGLTHSSWE